MLLFIIRLDSKGDGTINDYGDVVCIVKFSAVTFKPLVNEVVDAVVTDVEKVTSFQNYYKIVRNSC